MQTPHSGPSSQSRRHPIASFGPSIGEWSGKDVDFDWHCRQKVDFETLNHLSESSWLQPCQPRRKSTDLYSKGKGCQSVSARLPNRLVQCAEKTIKVNDDVYQCGYWWQIAVKYISFNQVVFSFDKMHCVAGHSDGSLRFHATVKNPPSLIVAISLVPMAVLLNLHPGLFL